MCMKRVEVVEKGSSQENKKALSPFYYNKDIRCVFYQKNFFMVKWTSGFFILCDKLEIAFPSRTAL